MVGHGGSSAGSYLADPTSPIPSHCASIVVTSTVRVNAWKMNSVRGRYRLICTINQYSRMRWRKEGIKWGGRMAVRNINVNNQEVQTPNFLCPVHIWAPCVYCNNIYRVYYSVNNFNFQWLFSNTPGQWKNRLVRTFNVTLLADHHIKREAQW